MPDGVYDEQGLYYIRDDPYRAALASFEDIYSGNEGEISRLAQRLPLPTLTEAASAGDRTLYNLLQAAHRSTIIDQALRDIEQRVQEPFSGQHYAALETEYHTLAQEQRDLQTNFAPYYQRFGLRDSDANPQQAIRNAILYGDLHPGIAQYSDPGINAYVNNLVSDAGRTDTFNALGDNLIPVVALLGLAVGGAALAGGFGAAPAAGAGATVGAETLAAPLPATIGAEGLAGTAITTGDLTALGGGGVGLGGGTVTGGVAGSPSLVSAGTAGGLGTTAGAPLTGAAAVGLPEVAAATGVLGTGLTAAQLGKLGTAALTVGSTLGGGGRGPETTQTSTVNFPEETRSLIGGVELPLLSGAIGEQSNVLSSLVPESVPQTGFRSTYGARASNAVKSATRRSAAESSIADLGPAFEEIEALSPQLVSSFQQLARQRAAQTQTVVPAGFSNFLAPSTTSRTTGGGPSAFETGFGLASTLGSAGLAFA